jgi:hypothetical protein
MGDEKEGLWQDWAQPGVAESGSRNLVVAEPSRDLTPAELVAEMQDAVPASSGESALPDSTIEMAAAAGDSLLERTGCPDPIGLQVEMAKLPQSDIDLLATVLAQAKATDDPEDIALAFERRATIDQLLRAKAWARQLPDELRQWLVSFTFARANDE